MSHGTGTPHWMEVREMETSSRPWRMMPSASLRLPSGCTQPGLASYQSSRGWVNFDSSKNQLSSSSHSTGRPWMGQLPSTRSASV